MLDFAKRQQKALKIIRIIEQHLDRPLGDLRVLEIGSSGGGMSVVFAQRFQILLAGDIDLHAIELASHEYEVEHLLYLAMDGMNLPVPDGTFDLVICNHVYEHMPNAERLMSEVERVLAPGGTCYFGCGNRFVFFDGEYGLPLLSILPRSLASIYLRSLRSKEYYERNLFYWELKRLVRHFKLTDWTWRVILNPRKYHAEAELPSWTRFLRFVPAQFLGIITPFLPSYLWTLDRKKET